MCEKATTQTDRPMMRTSQPTATRGISGFITTSFSTAGRIARPCSRLDYPIILRNASERGNYRSVNGFRTLWRKLEAWLSGKAESQSTKVSTRKLVGYDPDTHPGDGVLFLSSRAGGIK
jgi:hypothetical protein